jgi:hypothetical protein
MIKSGVRLFEREPTYVASEPDGPVIADDATFVLGASWGWPRLKLAPWRRLPKR